LTEREAVFKSGSSDNPNPFTFPGCANTFGRELIEEKLSLSSVEPDNQLKKNKIEIKKPESHFWVSGSESINHQSTSKKEDQ